MSDLIRLPPSPLPAYMMPEFINVFRTVVQNTLEIALQMELAGRLAILNSGKKDSMTTAHAMAYFLATILEEFGKARAEEILGKNPGVKYCGQPVEAFKPWLQEMVRAIDDETTEAARRVGGHG